MPEQTMPLDRFKWLQIPISNPVLGSGHKRFNRYTWWVPLTYNRKIDDVRDVSAVQVYLSYKVTLVYGPKRI